MLGAMLGGGAEGGQVHDRKIINPHTGFHGKSFGGGDVYSGRVGHEGIRTFSDHKADGGQFSMGISDEAIKTIGSMAMGVPPIPSMPKAGGGGGGGAAAPAAPSGGAGAGGAGGLGLPDTSSLLAGIFQLQNLARQRHQPQVKAILLI